MDAQQATEQAREICATKDSLLRKYHYATGDYSRAMEVLDVKLGTLKKLDYQTIRQAAEDYRKLSDEARDELDRHMAEHGC
jgi:hypothetical protein